MSQIDDLYPFIINELPRCPKSLMLQKSIEIIRDFCMRCEGWEYELDAIDIKDGETDYDIDSPVEDTEIALITLVKQDDITIYPGADYTIPVNKSEIKLEAEPTSDSSAALEITATLKPIKGATNNTEIPDRFFNDWCEIWSKGVMSRLMMMPKQPWTDKEMARDYRFDYEKGIGDARIEASKGRTKTSLTVSIPSFSR